MLIDGEGPPSLPAISENEQSGAVGDSGGHVSYERAAGPEVPPYLCAQGGPRTACPVFV